MRPGAFDWSKFETAQGSAAQIPKALHQLRNVSDVDALRQALGEIAAYGLDNGYLTPAAAPLCELLLDEALASVPANRPAWPYLVHVLLSLGAGRSRVGLPPTRLFSPLESETERVRWYVQHRQRQAAIESAVAARRALMISAANSAPARDAVHILAVMSVATALRDEHWTILAKLYERLENDAQRASLLLICQTPVPDPILRGLLQSGATEPSPYVRAAAWCAKTRIAAAPVDHGVSGPDLEAFIEGADRFDEEFVWYEGLLGGVVCQAIGSSAMTRATKMDLLFACLRRSPPEPPVLVSVPSAAAWEIFTLVFAQHYQSRRPLDHSDLSPEELCALAQLRDWSANWLETGHQFSGQFGIFQFNMTANVLIEPPIPLQRTLSEPWPGDPHLTSTLCWLQRPLLFSRTSSERAGAFALLARRLVADLDDTELLATLRIVPELAGYPCRELALSLHYIAVDDDRTSTPDMTTNLTSFRRAIEGWADEPLANALCELFALRAGARV